MSQDFKNKLRDYADGKLSPEESTEVKREIDKMEAYQTFLEEELIASRPPGNSRVNGADISKSDVRIILKAKWMARLHNALTALAIIIFGTVLCSIITAIFYSTGDPDRSSVYRDVVQSTIAVTEPNLLIRGNGTGINPFFSMDFKGNLKKEVGGEMVDAGTIQTSFLFSQVRYPDRSRTLNRNGTWPFSYPESANVLNSDWAKLEKLPEGTVAEAYISFDEFYTTGDVLNKFRDKDMQPVWFVVDTGFDNVDTNTMASFIGFPYHPIWHPEDMMVTNSSYEKKGMFFKVESGTSPAVEDYGSAEIRNENFMKTLTLLNKYEKIANRVALGGNLKISERIKYLQKNGIKLYGIVVTGPSKEILKLKSEPWVAGIHLGEVRLWNWNRIK